MAAVLLLGAVDVHAEKITLENDHCRADWCSERSSLSLEAPGFPRIGISEIELAEKAVSVEQIKLSHPVWGEGRGLKVAQSNGRFTEFILYDGLPFLAVQSGLKNETDELLQIDKFSVFEASLDFGKPAGVAIPAQ